MHIADKASAAQHLSHISYYRLRAYWLPFEQVAAQGGQHAFVAGTDFDTILAIYQFDRELRLLLIDAIERVEISLRTQMASVLSLRYGAFAHQEAQHFSSTPAWEKCRDELTKEYQRSRETFALHYRNQYPHLHSPPLWVACELMTLGQLSHWLKNLRHPKDRQDIAHLYGLDEKVLLSFAHHLTTVRNHCAHHGRVWNRKFAIKMLIPKKKPHDFGAQLNHQQDRHLYNTLAMLAYLMGIISPSSTWRMRLKHLIQSTPQIAATEMGFPPDWEQLAIWQKTSANPR
jgi:abortive infection bacteriophage resistance protein